MTEQMSLFDANGSALLKERGMNRVHDNAEPEIREQVYDVIRYVAGQLPELTSDDVQREIELRELDLSTLHPNTVGALFSKAAKAKLIRNTERTMRTTRTAGHARRITVWQSLVRGAE